MRFARLGMIALIGIAGAAAIAQAQAQAQERMPPIPPDQMTDAQKKIVADMVSSPRGRLPPPMVPMLRSPDLMTRIGGLGDHILFHNSLSPKIFEQTVLMVARQWTQQFEWRHHYPLALKVGVKQETVDAIAEGRRPPGLDEQESAAYDFATELLVNKSVSDPTYARFLGKFSEENVMDMIGTLGFYTSISMVINVDRTPIEPGTAPLLKPLP